MNDVIRELKRLSKAEGGAWVAVPRAFEPGCEYHRYQSPCKVSGYALEQGYKYEGGNLTQWGDNRYLAVGYKGKIVGPSMGVVIREQNRGLNCDR